MRNRVSPNAPCPCGSSRKLKKCCTLFHRGRPAVPRRLMPARYTAYVLADAEFLIRTTHPDGPQWQDDPGAWRAEIIDYCRATEFAGLEILDHAMDETAGRAYVTFRADLRRDRQPVGFTERSLFLREGNRWLYHSGETS